MIDGINIFTKDIDELDIVWEVNKQDIFKERLLQRSKRSLEFIYTDVYGPISPAIQNNKQ